MELNGERLAAVFTALCEIDSPSRREGKLSAYLQDFFQQNFKGIQILEDRSSAQTGSDCNNLLVRFAGQGGGEPLFFNCHLDTVEPGTGVKVRREGEVFTSAGDTILGADDKSGIAILIEVLRTLEAEQRPYPPLELVFTTCEEIGLLGAKALDLDLLQAQTGFALDSTGTDQVIIGAPAANKLFIEIQGRAAHAGLNPEEGINAIQLAARALANLNLGRLDAESTANIGLITGGTATNIIPALVTLEGEVRSHQEAKLAEYTRGIEQVFRQVINPVPPDTSAPSLRFRVSPEYPALKVEPDDALIGRIDRAAATLGRPIRYLVAGGGSDANIFHGAGLKTAILATGMQKVHSTEETIRLSDMMRTAELVGALIIG